MKLLNKHKGVIADRIEFFNESFSIISTYLDLLNEGVCAIEADFTVSKMQEKPIILGEINDFDDSDSFHEEFMRFCKAENKPKLNLSFPIGGFFQSMEAFLMNPSQPTRFFSFDPKGLELKESGLYITGYTRGYYGQTNDLPKRMAAFAKENGLLFNGPVYNIFLFDEVSLIDPEQYLLQVSASVKEDRAVFPQKHQKLYGG